MSERAVQTALAASQGHTGRFLEGNVADLGDETRDARTIALIVGDLY